MGMGVEPAQLMLVEHKRRPITGRMLMIGRPSTWFSPELAMQLVEEAGVSIRPNINIYLDNETFNAKIRPDHRWISDKSFFELFTDAEVTSVDVSDFEGAEVVHDMCTPLPSHMIGAYDFIFDGSSLDNIFDPASAIRNYSAALKPGGRMLMQNMGSPHCSPYMMFPGEWFSDFFLVNNYADCRVHQEYFTNQFYEDVGLHTFGWDPFVQDGDDLRAISSMIGDNLPEGMTHVAIIVLVEKGTASTDHLSPVQYGYRGAPGSPAYEQYKAVFREMRKSTRTWFELPKEQEFMERFSTPNGFTYLGTRRKRDDPWKNFRVPDFCSERQDREISSRFLAA